MHEDIKEHVGRFVLKVSMAALIAIVVKSDNYLRTFSLWVFAYAALAVLFAIVRQEQYSRNSITYWDEAMWLCTAAMTIRIVGEATRAS